MQSATKGKFENKRSNLKKNSYLCRLQEYTSIKTTNKSDN